MTGPRRRSSGRVADQATVHGLPAKVRDLGLKLTLVRRIDPDYPEGQWISRERERLTNAIDRVTGDEP
jgi:hypothetical protein